MRAGIAHNRPVATGEIFAALDFGTGGGKCALFRADGHCIAVRRETWTYREEPVDPPGFTVGYSFDPEAFWAALARCTRAALADAGIPAAAVRGVSTTAQRLGTVLLDAAGREIYAGPNLDGRGFSGGMEAMSTLGLERTVAITGHWPPVIGSLARLLTVRGRPGGDAIATVLTLSDWIGYRLTGERFSEPSNAGESLLLDIGRRTWSREIVEAFDLDERVLPPLVAPGTRVGSVTAAAAAATGLAAGTPVFAGGADTPCALLGSDVVEPDEAGVVLGTTTPVMVVTAGPEIDPAGRLWTGCHVVPGRWEVESNGGDTGIAWEWLLGFLGLEGDAAFARAEEEVAALPPEPLPAFSVAGPQVFDLPTFNPNQAMGFLLRMPPFTARPRRAHLLRAFLENVACAVRGNLEQIESFRGRAPSSVTLSGGMTRSPGMMRALARILRQPLLVSREPHATALGAAVIAAAGLGTHRDIPSAAAAMVRRDPVEPEPGATDAWDAHYARWREIYGQLRATTL